ncbi:MAG: sigma-54-dependent Fis family transcriptional regulator [Vicinamibacteria bacterium]|nr:sigma-54-dependent Fis family transcriptional regulator [Vicinamibacteria bacterium]
MKPRVLLIDDDPGTLASLSRAFALEGYVVDTASAASQAFERLAAEPVEAILSDVVMPGMNGLEFLAEIRRRVPEVPVILMSGQATIEMAVQATRLGALDFVEKPVGLERLLLTLRNALRLDRLERENRELLHYWRDELALIGDSAPMLALRALIERAAPSDVSILVLGENGTGKELVARAIHELSSRHDQPFVKMNCAAVPADLIESELFGHEKGAFTGAVAQRRGRFDQADGGTLFLDEIGDMSLAMQSKLLRVLEDGEVLRVGGANPIRVDIRLISATNRDLGRLLSENRFREDLYYRISTLSIRTPPLRERREDLPALATHFIRGACRRNHWKEPHLSPEALDILRAQPYKGNVRELRNLVERLLILSESDPISTADVRTALPSLATSSRSAVPGEGTLYDLTQHYEREVIRERLRLMMGHITKTARSLGLERSHLYKKCRQLGIEMRETGD